MQDDRSDRQGRAPCDGRRPRWRALRLACAVPLSLLPAPAALTQTLTQTLGSSDPADIAAAWQRPSLSFFGVPGLLDMPGAHQMPDADLAVTFGGFETTGKVTGHFQFTKRLSGVFRYSYVDDLLDTGDYFDRSFDLRFQIAEETATTPAVTIGLQDFGGTEIFSAEYIVAAKTFGPLRATLGLGWGRLGSYNGFTNPISAWEDRGEGRGLEGTGQLNSDNWFRGDVAPFGGIEYQATDRLRLTLEYSSDDYEREQENIDFPRNSPLNFGMDYRLQDNVQMRLAYLYGSSIGAQFSYVFNPRTPNDLPRASGPGPLAVTPRAPGTAEDLGWTQVPDAPRILADAVAEALAPEDIEVDELTVAPTRAVLRIRNDNMSNAQAIGRTARVLTRVMPASVETFEIIPVSSNGLSISRVVIARSDVEDLVNAPDGAWQSFARARIDSGYGVGERGTGVDIIGSPVTGNRDPFTWGIGPYLEASYFDPNAPIRLDFGLRARARWEPTSGLVFATELRQLLAGNRDELPPSNSAVQPVRSDANLYAAEDTTMRQLTAAKYFRPGPDLYGRVTLGYLEQMYAGVSTEVLWKPVNSRLALGTEINYARQRDFDQGFGLQDYDTVTGHVSAYYKTQGDYHYQLDLGRYLAEDWGGTLTIDREFANGTKIGVFATLTDMPFEDFGEGSFDKGVRVEIPFSVLTGDRRDGGISRTIRPVLRDGGAKLVVPGRLYGSVRSWHTPALQDRWGRFWR